jgi:hypothetical protein
MVEAAERDAGRERARRIEAERAIAHQIRLRGAAESEAASLRAVVVNQSEVAEADRKMLLELRSETERLRLALAGRGSVLLARLRENNARINAADALLREAIPLWHEWRTTDITADDDRWAEFTNRAHDWHDRVRRHVRESGDG